LVVGLSIIGFIRQKNENKSLSNNLENNKISVIIAVRNEEHNIITCLNSLVIQDFNKDDFEIIIVDDNSTDDTVNVINRFCSGLDYPIKVFSLQDTFSKKEALKYGVQKASYPIIATTDADCILPIKWLEQISEQFNANIEMLLGPVMFTKNKTFLEYFQVLDMLAIQGIEFGMLNFKHPILNNGANLSYSKKQFNILNGYDKYKTPSGDDIFLLEKFKKTNKIKGLLAKEFIVETKAEITLTNFINQRLRWASKTKYYKDKLLVFISSIVFFQNIIMVFIYSQLIFVEKYSLLFAILLLSKWLIDFILLFLVACFFDRRKALFYFIPIQIVYPIYIVIISITAMITTFEWKGRKYNE
jgi:glycosyltransferase involved in cell wall biosynthesis